MKAFQVGEDQVVMNKNPTLSKGTNFTVYLIIQGEDVKTWDYYEQHQAEKQYIEQLHRLVSSHLEVIESERTTVWGKRK